MWIIIGLVTALIVVGAGLLLVLNSIIGPAPAPLRRVAERLGRSPRVCRMVPVARASCSKSCLGACLV